MILILGLLLFAGTKAQFNLTSLSTVTSCSQPNQVSFHPTNNTLVAVACQSSINDTAILYNVGSNTLNQVASKQTGTQNQLNGIKFYPSQPNYALITVWGASINILQINSSSITSLYSFTEADNTMNVDISSTSSFAIVVAISYLKIYTLTTSTVTQQVRQAVANNATSCLGVVLVSNTTALLTCSGYGIFQYAVNSTSATYQTSFPLSGSALFGITFVSGSTTQGIYSSNYDQSYYSFSFNKSVSLTNTALLNLGVSTFSCSYSADNSKLVVGAASIITLYTTLSIANCYTIVPPVCTTCNSGYYLANSTSCLLCSNISSQCQNCSQTSFACTSCSSGYYLANSTSCLLCSNINSQCQNCSQTSNACTSCSSGYYLASATACTACSAISAQCSLCNSSSFCAQCNSGYYLSSPTSCLVCSNIAQCLTCNQTANACLSCNSGYYLASATTCATCSSAIAQCTNCSNSSTCSQCSSGYFLANTSSCLSCSNITGCSTCNQTSKACISCNSGYYLANSSSCLPCSAITNCTTCNQSQNACLTCNAGYYLASATLCTACTSITSQCSNCTNSTTCTNCNINYYLANSTACLQCSNILNCVTCNQSSNACLTCNIGYYLQSSTTCAICSSAIAQCTNCSNSSTCSQCSSGYFLANASSCLACSNITNCSTCNQTSQACISCINGSYLASATSCLVCSNIPQCLTCNQSANACLSCNSGYYLASATTCTACSAISAQCGNCSNASTCTSCNSGYYLASPTSCLVCSNIAQCLTCNQTANACLSCNSGYYLQSSTTCATCSSAIAQCTNCSNSSTCSQCSSGYFLANSSSCLSCSNITGCSTCNQTSKACTSCNSGYYLANSSSCLPCSAITNCTTCNQSQNACLTCNAGYYLASATLCSACTSITSQCSNCTNSATCTKCNLNYYLANNTTCLQCSNILNCVTCNQSSNSCLNCSTGYYVNSSGSCSSCSSITSQCINCTGSSNCTQCNTNYYLQNQTSCQLCSNILNCLTCNQTSNSCLTCITGYYLQSSTTCTACSSVIAQCTNCTNSSTCTQCSSGYYLATPTSCLLCSNITNCSTCNQTSKACFSCNAGNFLANSTTCLQCSQIHNCSTCNQTSYACLTCNNGYYLSSATSCSACTTISPQCALCSNAYTCITCNSGYYLANATSCVNTPLIANCYNYTQSLTACLICNTGYFLSSSTSCTSCTAITTYCALCSSSNTCVQCASGYYLSTSTSCFRCSAITQCSTCTQNSNLCLSCNQGYYLAADSLSCISCTSINQQCSSCLNSQNCTQCNCGYYLVSATSCVSCSNIAQCSECSQTSNQCLSCEDRYYLSADGTACTSCASITPQCQFCSHTSSCSYCNSGYYLASSTSCLPCSTMANCAACNQTANACLGCNVGFYLSGAAFCVSCSNIVAQCIQCSQSGTACFSCNSGYLLANATSCAPCSSIPSCTNCSQSSNTCTMCNIGYQLAANSLSCVPCSSINAQCQTCSNLSTCTSCNNGFYLQNTISCLPCSTINAQCSSCSQAAPVCTGCVGTIGAKFSRILPNCNCPSGYYSDLSVQADCIACSYKCGSCSNSSACDTCAVSRSNPPTCPCSNGQQDDGTSTMCGTCSYACETCTANTVSSCTACYGSSGQNSSRILPACTCPLLGFWDNYPYQSECQACANTRCLSCTNSTSICTACVGTVSNSFAGSRTLPTCGCPNGYYDNAMYNDCQTCAVQCLTCVTAASNCVIACNNNCYGCTGTASTCLQCNGDRINAPNCQCPAGKYDNFVSQLCQNCDQSCYNCTLSLGCVQCQGNRAPIAPYASQCACQNTTVFGISYLPTTWYCTTCTDAVLSVQFTSDYTGITVEFGVQISFVGYSTTTDTSVFSNALCVALLDNVTLTAMGQACQCGTATASQFTAFTVQFGRQPTLLLNGTVQILPNTVLRQGCLSQTFKNFYLNQVVLPPNPTNPSALLSGPTSQVSLCQQLTISVNQQFFDGLRGLTNFTWILKQTTAQNTVAIQSLLNTLNGQQMVPNTLTIPVLTLQSYSQYKILLSFQNFLGLKGSATFVLNTTSTAGAEATITQQTPLTFKTFQINSLSATYSYLDCSSGQVVVVQQGMQITWEDITNGAQKQLSQTISQIQQTSLTISIAAFILTPGVTYTYQINVIYPPQPLLYAANSIQFSVSISPLIVLVVGGSRIQGFGSELDLQGSAIDPDLPSTQQSNNISVSWSCLDLNTNGVCVNVEGFPIQLNNTYQLSYIANFFEPYSCLQFTFNAMSQTNSNKNGTAIGIIIIVETDIPVLIVNIPTNMLTSKINKNDDLSISVNFDGDVDEVFFALVFTYNFNVVATRAYAYPLFAFKIWDLFNDFNANTDTLLIRISLYNPQYYMPSQTSYTITVNFEPVPGTISVLPQTGTSLTTQFAISLSGWYDEDAPLSYRYVFYTQASDYQTEIVSGENPTSALRNTVIDFTPSSQANITLPQGVYDASAGGYQILVMVSISDSLGAIYNITQNVTINPDNTQQSLDTYLSTIQKYYQEAITLTTDQQIQQLNILALDYTLFDENSVQSCAQQGTCNGQGQCTLQSRGSTSFTACHCQSNYYLRDCSATLSQYTTYLQTKKALYDTLNGLQNQSASQSIQDQVIKSINLLLQLNDLGQLLSQDEADAAISSIATLISSQNDMMASLSSQGLLNQGLSQISRQVEASNSILGKSLGFLDNMVGTLSVALNSSNARDRRLTTTSVNQSLSTIFNLTQSVSSAIYQTALPNADPVTYSGTAFSQNMQIATTKTVQALFQSNNQQNNIIYNDSSANTSSSFDPSAANSTSTLVYKLSQRGFNNNPLQYDSTYPYPGQTSQLISIDIQSSASNSSDNINISQSLPINFPPVQSNNASATNASTVCISRSSNGQWTNQNCQSVQQNGGSDSSSQSNTTSMQCVCQTLGPTTVVADIDGLFAGTNLKQIFSVAGLQALANFPFYKSYIFYIFAVSTLLVILFIIYGYRADRKKILTIQSIVFPITEMQNAKINQQQQVNNTDQLNKLRLQVQQIPLIISERQQLNLQNNQDDENKQQEFKFNEELSSAHSLNQKALQVIPSIKEEEPKTSYSNKMTNSVLKRLGTKKDQNKQKSLIFEFMQNQQSKNQSIVDLQPEEQNNRSSLDQIEFISNNQLQKLNSSSITDTNMSPVKRQQVLPEMIEIQEEKEADIEQQQQKEQQLDPAKQKNLKTKKPRLSDGVIRLHELFGIFIIYDKDLSRPSRFVLYYLKISTMITLSAIFSQKYNLVQSIIVTLLCALFIAIPSAVLASMLKSSYFCLQALGVLLIIAFLALDDYVSLVNAALMGLDASNTWAQTYVNTFVLDTFTMVIWKIYN